MTGVVVCHGSAAVRERIVAAAHGVPALAPARSAASVEELIVMSRRSAPALVLLDAHLPGIGPIEALRRLRETVGPPIVIMIAVPGDEITLDRAIALGARGYLAPDVDRSELAAVAAHSLASTMVSQFAPTERARGQRPPERETGSGPRLELTKRELEVLIGMSHGRSNAQIGADLFLSEDTVKTHARRLFRKLGAADRAQAVAMGLRQGLIR
jgi:two-component system, NarL family, nitrate/nitrite response regulator NarL